MKRILSLLLLGFLHQIESAGTSYSQNQFTCQGTSYSDALSKCPDKGVLKMSSGGNVTVFVRSANNIPNYDHTGPSAGVSDPYVRFTVGSVVKETRNIRNDLNPVWNEFVNLGVLGSGTLINVEIWDKDSGLEFSDDLCVTGSVRVPFCTTFSANTTTANCGADFGCSSQDSLWHMPTQQECVESGYISFVNGQFCISGICLQLDFHIVPFAIGVEKIFKNSMQSSPSVNAFAYPVQGVKYTKNLGVPFSDLPGTTLDYTQIVSSQLRGALMYQMKNTERYYGAANAIKFYGSTNFPANIYICRDTDDNSGPPFGLGVPTWLSSSYSSQNISIQQLVIDGTTVTFGCFFMHTDGTIKNQYGGVLSGAIPFKTNTISGYEGIQSSSGYNYNYIILAVPYTIAPREDSLTIIYDMAAFISYLFSYGLIFAIFTYCIALFLRKIDYRVDRLSSFLSTRVLTGDDKCLLATLFLTYHESPCNIHYRAHMFHLRNTLVFILSIPFWLLISWGFSVSVAVRPAGLGYAVAFIGPAALFFWFGMRLWEASLWRLPMMAATSLSLAVLFFICFLISVLFTDPAVLQLARNINFAALSLVFGTINVVPLLHLVFTRDKSQQKHLAALMDKMLDAIFYVRKKGGAKGRTEKSPNIFLNTNKLLHALLGETYTINPHVPAFQLAAILQEFPLAQQADDDSGENTSEEKKAALKEAKEKSHRLYNISLFVLFLYFVVAAVRTNHPGLAFLNILSLVFLDFIHVCLSRGDICWSPGFIIALMAMGRLLIMGSGASIWVLNYSAAYMMYAVVLVQEVINTYLPNLSTKKAGRMVFAGEAANDINSRDVSGTPFFCLGALTLAYCGVLVVAVLGSTNGELPSPTLDVLGNRTTWTTNVFGLIALLSTIVFGLLWATIRAFYLQHHGLLRGWARDGFVFKKKINVSVFLTICLEVSILASGVLVYGVTGSNVIIVSAIYLPMIAVCLGYAYYIWAKNDFELVVWPRKEFVLARQNENASDLTVAFKMIEDQFGQDLQIENMESGPETMEIVVKEKKTLKGFKLPPIKAPAGSGNVATAIDDDVKMPPLPLKSVLRRKRQNLGIKTKKPPVSQGDLRARDNAKDSDVFGDEGDVLDAEDPWAQYELAEEDPNAKKKKVAITATVKTIPFMESGPVLMIRKYFMIVYNFCAPKISYVVGLCRRHAKLYPFKAVKAEEDPEAGEEVVDALKEMKRESVSSMSFNRAAWTGNLTRAEYTALASWYGGMLLIMFYGITLSKTVVPDYLGLLIWVSSWLVICTVVPVLKYFNTYTFDDTMLFMVKFNLTFHFFFCLLFFVVTLQMDIGVVGALWLFDYFLYYPVFVFVLFEAYRWYDCGFKYQSMDLNHDGKISVLEFLTFIRSFPFVIFAAVIFNWQLYVWVNYLTGQTVTLMLISCGLAYLFIRDWAVNEFYLSPEMMYAGWIMINLTLIITFMVALFSDTIPLFSSSIFCFTLSFKIMIKNLSRHYLLDPQASIVFFSPQIFPVYSYNSKQQDLVDESHVIKDVASVFTIGIVWGSLLAIFYYPINVGIAIACGFLLGLGAAVSVAVSYVPGKLAKAAALLNAESIIEVAGVAKEKFFERKQPLNLESTEDEDDDVYPVLTEEQERDMELAKERASKASLDKQKERQSITIAVDIINDTRSLKYVKQEHVESNIADLQLEDEYDPTWYQKMAAEAKQFLKSLFEAIPVNRMEGWQKHSEASFTATDALSEAILTGRGALGMFGFNGFWRYLFDKCKKSNRFKFLYPKFLDDYDEQGNNTKLVQLTEKMDTRSIFGQLLEYDKALDWTYMEECRCAVHFLLMMLVDADAKLNREQVLFQKFLRENRFRLASNGIVPPPEIFSSESFASINIPLVAVWLSTLSDDEVERFHTLKKAFSEEQRAKDELIDAADYDLFIDARNIEKERSQRDRDWAELFDRHVLMQKEERYQQFANTLLGLEKQRFLQRKDAWTSDPDCFVILKERDLYQRFKAACCNVEDEITEFVNRTIADIEASQKDTRLGEYGRTYQFVDSTFTPNENSLGQGPANEHVLGWRCAPGISDMVDLFSSGPHPDHIDEGVFGDTWLISALVMLVAASGFGENVVSELVSQLFVRHPSEDGDPTLDTDVGAYCVRIYRNGDFFPIILDDLVPMRRKEKWTNENRGMACAHNRECRGIWISLVEKAFAKYFGSYAALQKGYIHHALRDLTGCESEWIPLASASRGIGKKQLWDDLKRFKRNGYILGAGTGDSKLVDKEIQNSGIVFNSEYTIYELIETDGLHLLKLRNPPGDHEEWKGDWGDNSSLWTRKIRGKLNMVFADDNTFYMSFDDFCNVFRNLYVCRYCKPDRWQREELLPGLWKKSDLKEVEKDEMMKQFMVAESDDNSQMAELEETASEKEAQKTLAATVDSAGGLPTKRNPTCVLENNPYYSLRIHRPTDFRICISQYSAKGNRSNFPIHPVSIFLIKNPAHLKTPVRLEKLNKEDVVAYSGPPVRQKVLNLYVSSCDPGLYIILVATSNAGMVGNFTISLLSNFRAEFFSLWPPEWVLQKEREHLPPGSGALMGNLNQDNRKTRKTGMFGSSSFIGRHMDILLGKKSEEDSDDESEEGGAKK